MKHLSNKPLNRAPATHRGSCDSKQRVTPRASRPDDNHLYNAMYAKCHLFLPWVFHREALQPQQFSQLISSAIDHVLLVFVIELLYHYILSQVMHHLWIHNVPSATSAWGAQHMETSSESYSKGSGAQEEKAKCIQCNTGRFQPRYPPKWPRWTTVSPKTR